MTKYWNFLRVEENLDKACDQHKWELKCIKIGYAQVYFYT